jgi:predicted RNase H-like nuclease
LQAWAIIPKIREVDSALRASAELLSLVREVHPEVCFYYLAGGRPMRHAKKKRAGRQERIELLYPVFGSALDRALADRPTLGCAVDDLLDAFVALWSARRVLSGEAITLPSSPEHDRYGLPMEMLA